MKKKMRKFETGGYTGDDPIVKYRMGMIDAQGNDLTKKPETTKSVLEETSSDLDPYGAADKKPISVEKTVVKTKVTPTSKSRDFDTTETEVVKPKIDALKKLKEEIGTGSMPKSFTAAGGNTKRSKSMATLPSIKFSMPDPLADFDSKGKRYSSRDTDDRRKGGAIKKMSSGGSASSRGDGIAKRGKTRGTIC
jgi:hypothetical protein